jgi:hypothetical protein
MGAIKSRIGPFEGRDHASPEPSLGQGQRPWRIYVSPEAPLQQRTHLRLARGPVFTKKPQKTTDSAPKDDGLRFARPQGSDSGSAPEDDELCIARPQGSDSGSAPEDDELCFARPQGSDSGSAPEVDELRFARPQGSDSALASADGLRLARPRGSDSTSALEDRLDLDLGGASTSPNPGLGPTTSQKAPSLPYPKLTQATGNKTGVPSSSLR